MKQIQDELGEIKPFVINKKIILSMDERWGDYFNAENPIFKVCIQNERIVIVGPKVNHTGPTSNTVSNGVDGIE